MTDDKAGNYKSCTCVDN